ncbi:hypothetical protein ACIBQX_39875 [Nonomuraea sp. NPDC049714]|uniref:hypothetical protein n=1 Tax=Nonomuraea sp. NPDC049714 TaxID=3364357 RepID=UPI00379B3383
MPLTRSSAGFRASPETGRHAGPPLVLGALLVAVTACTQPQQAPEPTTGISGVADLKLPFDAYKPTPAQRALLGNAHNLVVVRCMRRHGVTVHPPGTNQQAIAAADPGNTRRYGVVDPEQAARFGYHLARPASPPEASQWAADLRQTARRHLYGKQGRPGCLNRAPDVLSRSAPEADWQWLAMQDARTLERAAKRAVVRRAVGKWAACMKAAGHSYPSPEAAIADPRWNLEGAEITTEEKRVAVADTSCKWSSGLVATWFTADAELQRRIVLKHSDRFADLRDNLGKRLDRATAMLERQGLTG